MIPDWNSQGVLPPVRPGAGGTAADRSPYRVSLHQLVTTFAISPERATVLRGFLDYRAALHAAGIIVGFQWVDGSFVENIQALEGREPNDVDVVTFCGSAAEGYDDLFASAAMKEAFHIDAFLYRIDPPLTSDRVRWIAYWYSLLAHRRSQLWKGFVQVDLSPVGDPVARETLNLVMQREGWQ